MLRPRESIARHLRLSGRPLGDPADFELRGAGRVVALIDGLPDRATEELLDAHITVRSWVESPSPDPHATFAASVMAGSTQGLSPRAHLLSAVVASAGHAIEPAHVAAAIRWAVDEGAQIIVIPLGDHRSHADVGSAIDQALGRGASVVAAAGNAHPHPLLFPARWPGVLAVGACDEGGALLEDSCRAPRLDLVLPALRIVASTGPGREAARSGTSVAAALAGGLLAG